VLRGRDALEQHALIADLTRQTSPGRAARTRAPHDPKSMLPASTLGMMRSGLASVSRRAPDVWPVHRLLAALASDDLWP
jgi:hypothetical protein